MPYFEKVPDMAPQSMKVILAYFVFVFASWHDVCSEEGWKWSTAVQLPKLGVGILDIQTALEKENAIVMALEAGYQMIDIWEGDEAVLKNALAKAKVARKDVFIVIKANIPEIVEEQYNITNAVDAILERLQTNYIDLFLLNYPEFNNDHIQRWKALVSLKNSNKIKLIGVSNFNYEQVMLLTEATGVLPSVVQLEINPFFQQKELVQNLTSKGIAIQAYSPLASGLKLSDSRLVSIAKSYDSTTAQLLIQWCIQKEYSCITKSRNKKHLESNINLGEFFIGDDDMKEIDAFDEGFVTNFDPSSQYDNDRSYTSGITHKSRRGRRGDDLDDEYKADESQYSGETSDYYSESDPGTKQETVVNNSKGDQGTSDDGEVHSNKDEF